MVDLVRKRILFVDMRSLERSRVYLNSISAHSDLLPAGYDFDRGQNRWNRQKPVDVEKKYLVDEYTVINM